MPDEIPKAFWLLLTRDRKLVWDRTLLAFIPTKSAESSISAADQMTRIWFLSGEECAAQARELNTMGVPTHSDKYDYKGPA
jgi:hypothetical protein